ncbi:hypothetical protein DERP_011734 [Dermatophagoides pteronyssinus]|uniref:Uncharacterized protein n=1 Tax=Dermatophagoides pteronyssinus TaxID=6956 RepID=A0ABQ8J365_DERPT|nr:hypothetical protein DERP_011734 [Dermatophagoides pteronyssinus]
MLYKFQISSNEKDERKIKLRAGQRLRISVTIWQETLKIFRLTMIKKQVLHCISVTKFRLTTFQDDMSLTEILKKGIYDKHRQQQQQINLPTKNS